LSTKIIALLKLTTASGSYPALSTKVRIQDPFEFTHTDCGFSLNWLDYLGIKKAPSKNDDAKLMTPYLANGLGLPRLEAMLGMHTFHQNP
jgi:hypothetical protein